MTGEGQKGIYVINVVDAVSTSARSPTSPSTSSIPLHEALITPFPFTFEAFHAANGSEYINHRVAELLHKFHIGTFTKSRLRHTNDNALIESKNRSIVRKWLDRIYRHPLRNLGRSPVGKHDYNTRLAASDVATGDL